MQSKSSTWTADEWIDAVVGVRLGASAADEVRYRIAHDDERPLAGFTPAELRQVRGGLVELTDEASTVDTTIRDEFTATVNEALALVDAELDGEGF